MTLDLPLREQDASGSDGERLVRQSRREALSERRRHDDPAQFGQNNYVLGLYLSTTIYDFCDWYGYRGESLDAAVHVHSR